MLGKCAVLSLIRQLGKIIISSEQSKQNFYIYPATRITAPIEHCQQTLQVPQVLSQVAR